MGYEISSGQLTELTKTGTVTFADFITEMEGQILSHSPGTIDSFQKCPLTKKIFVNRGIGNLLFEMIKKRPIRLVHSKKLAKNTFFSLEDVSIDQVYLGMFLSYTDRTVEFFTKDYVPEFETDGIVVVYGEARARYIQKDEDVDGSYLLKQGYASGDKLATKDYPFVYK
jgi:hypothetical protein